MNWLWLYASSMLKKFAESSNDPPFGSSITLPSLRPTVWTDGACTWRSPRVAPTRRFTFASGLLCACVRSKFVVRAGPYWVTAGSSALKRVLGGRSTDRRYA